MMVLETYYKNNRYSRKLKYKYTLLILDFLKVKSRSRTFGWFNKFEKKKKNVRSILNSFIIILSPLTVHSL